MKINIKLLNIAGLAVAFASCASADITWNFNTTTFCLHCGFSNELDNDIKAGSFFTTDNTGANLTGWDITVEGTNNGVNGADNEYTPGDSFRTLPMDANHIDLYDGSSGQYIDLFFDAPGTTSAGGTVNLLQGDLGADSNSTIVCNGCGTLVSGSVTGSAVPEPRFGAILMLGLAGLAFLGRRKFAAARG
jgi:hypothetical protein